MTPDQLWHRYSRIWSSDRTTRDAELPVCLADACRYCDINGSIEGYQALSDYMEGFQHSVKGGAFRIRSVMHHHDRMLAEWELLGLDGTVLQTGRSFATVATDGRLASITGFFDARN